jgi:excisionase family DNA binding protein
MRNLPIEEHGISPLLDTKQAAQTLNVHDQTLRNKRSKGTLDLPFIRIGGTIRYRREDIEAFIARHREEGGAK